MPVLIRELDIAWPMHMLPSKCCIEKSIAYKTDVEHSLNYQAWHAKPRQLHHPEAYMLSSMILLLGIEHPMGPSFPYICPC